MNNICNEFVEYITSKAPRHNKKLVIEAVIRKYKLIKDRKVYHNDYFAVRFSSSKYSTNSFGNTILSLSTLEKFDHIPFFVVHVRREADNLILLANTTLLRKVSHSSKNLSLTNIKGSFNGSDIIRVYDGTLNSPENFDYLFTIHQGYSWDDNLARLVEATSNIKPVSQKFEPNKDELANIYSSIQRANAFVTSNNFHELEKDLNERCNQCRNEIIIASHIENTNIRGRLIESLITSESKKREEIIANLKQIEKILPSYDTKNGLGDYYREFDNGETYTDIKTKVVYLSSNPKAYNIDKFLKQMSDTRSIFLFFFIGIDVNSILSTRLCSVYNSKLIDNTLLQMHWAGRSTRGVAQFSGIAIEEILEEPEFQNRIDKKKAKDYLDKLLSR